MNLGENGAPSLSVRLSDDPRHGTVPAEDQNASAAVPHRRRPISAKIHAAAVAIHVAGDQIRPLGKAMRWTALR
jgi:hypothetical protein